MLKTNFIEIIQTFDKEEFKGLIEFTASPYHNTNKALVKLMDAVKKYYPDFGNRNFTKEKVYSKVFSSSGYNDQVMRNLMSDALRLAYSFLSNILLKTDNFQNSIYLLRQLRSRKLDSQYQKLLKQIQRSVNEERTINFFYFESLYRIENEEFLSELSHNRQQEIYPVIVRQSEYLTYDYISKLINHLIDMEVNEKYFNVENKFGFAKDIFKNIDIEKILSYLKQTSEKEHSILSLFYYRAMSMLKGDEGNYIKFKTLFFENSRLLDRGTRYNLITSLETYCIDNIKNDPEKYRNELHEVHLKTIDLNVLRLYDGDYLNMMRFWNIFINSTEISKTEWAEKFVNEHYTDLEPEVQQGALNFANGIINYKRKDYDKALEYFNKTRLNMYLFKLTLKTFYLRTFYEKGDYESAMFALDSYKQFLYKNKKISEAYREGYLNFAGILHDLIRLKTGEREADELNIRHKIETIPNIYNKQWVLEKINELSI